MKTVRVMDTASEVVDYSLNPLPKQLGQKYGSRFPALRKAILALDAAPAAQRLLAGESIAMTVEGAAYEVLPEEVEVRAQAHAGFAVATEGPYLAALVTDLTPELVQEGLAREFVRRLQDLRKQAELEISDRIQVSYHATPGLQQAVEAFRDYIMGETLAVELTAGKIPANVPTVSDSFDGEQVTIAFVKAA